MSAIILDRLGKLTADADGSSSVDGGAPVVVVVEDKAVELAARKVMAENGDLRLCLDVVRLAVELAEAEWRKAVGAAAAKAAGEGTKPVEVPVRKAGMTHVLKALQKAKAVASSSSSAMASASSATASSSSAAGPGPRTPGKKTVHAGTVQKIQALNIQSRLVLVALVVHSRRASLGLAPLSSSPSSSLSSTSASPSSEPTTAAALLSTYAHLLSSADSPVHKLNPSDFHTVLGLLADAALVSLAQATPSKRRGKAPTPASALVQLACLEDEVVKGLVGKPGAGGAAGGGGAEEEEARRILEREEGRMERLKARLGKERKMEKACPVEDRL